MGDQEKAKVGTIGWIDLTVENAEVIRDFYCDVVGWQAEDHDMGAYNDYDIKAPDSQETVTGICHARETNAHVPPQWLIYIHVADVDQSVARCLELGGKVIDGPRMMGQSRFCVIQDPAGAVVGLLS
ncbi:MAG: VOC family protein [Chloroflexota bacterium]